jgi:hypothetical protein
MRHSSRLLLLAACFNAEEAEWEALLSYAFLQLCGLVLKARIRARNYFVKANLRVHQEAHWYQSSYSRPSLD